MKILRPGSRRRVSLQSGDSAIQMITGALDRGREDVVAPGSNKGPGRNEIAAFFAKKEPVHPAHEKLVKVPSNRRSFVARAIKAGERFTAENVRVIRPGHGLEPDALGQILGCRATRDIAAATPMDWSMVGDNDD